MAPTTDSPLVSVIIPAYNQGPLLARAIRSVLAQTYERREIIVVNDGSTDDVTRRTVMGFGEAIVYAEQPNGGVAAARNTGIERARGQLIALLDQDDMWLPHKLDTQMEALAANPGVAVVHSSYHLIGADGHRSGTARLPEGRYRPLPRLFVENHIIPCTVVFDRALVPGELPFDPSVNGSDDWDLWLRLALEGHDFYCIAEPLAEYRVHADMTSRDSVFMARAGLRVLDKVYARNSLHESAYRVRGRAYGLRHGWAAWVLLAGGDLPGARAHLAKAAEYDLSYVTSPTYARVLVRACAGTKIHPGRLLLSILREAGVDGWWVRRAIRSVRLAKAFENGRDRALRRMVGVALRHPLLAIDPGVWTIVLGACARNMKKVRWT
jgi:glycosyltransferase involved in cell wall biosynthesis